MSVGTGHFDPANPHEGYKPGLPPEEIHWLKTVEQNERLLALLKWLVGGGGTVFVGLFTGAVIWWANAVNDIETTKKGLLVMEKARQDTLAEWHVWRAKKDEISTRLVVVLENTTKVLERQQTQIDALVARGRE